MPSIYRVLLDGQLVTETENEIAAWASYRTLLRRGDLRASRPLALIEADGDELHSARCDGCSESIEVGAFATPNDVLKQLMRGRYTEAEIKQACAARDYPVSNSRLQGWLAGTTNRKYQAMTLDELYIVASGLE
jgi:hypothetical protein